MVNSIPVLSGFHSDPTVCRVGSDFYLACSSFEYFPGAPVFRSSDMASWSHLGHVIDRTSQADLTGGGSSTGIYGSTLRHHGNRFWFATTDIGRVHLGQLLFTADTAEGPWSDPVVIPGAIGIDPDLAWDDDGECYLTWCAMLPGLSGIVQARIDPTNGALLEEPRPLWSGTGMRNPEGPHLYKVGAWWYLLVAEGGTDRGHSVSIARGRHPEGPFAANPANPILTHRSLDHPVQSVGHADFVDDGAGQWWAVYHGTRPRGVFPEFHVLGRETFVAPVIWVDGWPVFQETELPGIALSHSFVDDFSSTLDVRWTMPSGDLGGVRTGESGLVLDAGPARGSARPLVTRVVDPTWTMSASIDAAEGSGRMLLHLDDNHWYAIEVGATTATALARVGFLESTVGTPLLTMPGDRIRIRSTLPIPMMPSDLADTHDLPAEGPDEIHLEVVHPDRTTTVLAVLDGRYLSTEVAGGFTGRTVGFAAVNGVVRVRDAEYAGHQ